MDGLTFHALYEDHAAGVRRFALWLTGSEEAADDITAETFLRAWTARSAVRATTARGYLLAIARNLVTDERRRLSRQSPIDDSFVSCEASPERLAEMNHLLGEIRKLPEGYGQPLLLYAAGGLTYDEIAQQLHLPLTTVKVRIHRARLWLSESLEIGEETRR